LVAQVNRSSLTRDSDVDKVSLKDPDELTSHGIGSIFAGDGFLIVAVLLSTAQTSIGSLLWLLLLIPAFFFFGRGFSDLLHARQIRRRLAQRESGSGLTIGGPQAPVVLSDVFKSYQSGRLTNPSSVTEKTTRQLE
jgi:hypothetical protein